MRVINVKKERKGKGSETSEEEIKTGEKYMESFMDSSFKAL